MCAMISYMISYYEISNTFYMKYINKSYMISWTYDIVYDFMYTCCCCWSYLVVAIIYDTNIVGHLQDAILRSKVPDALPLCESPHMFTSKSSSQSMEVNYVNFVCLFLPD